MTDLTILLLVLMMGAAPATHLAQSGTNSTPRINQGAASGALTGKEAARLRKEQDRVQVARKERAGIEHRQDRASKHIYR